MGKYHDTRIDLTPDQTHRLKETFGHEIDSVELKIEELEQRIAPSTLMQACCNGTHIKGVIITA